MTTTIVGRSPKSSPADAYRRLGPKHRYAIGHDDDDDDECEPKISPNCSRVANHNPRASQRRVPKGPQPTFLTYRAPFRAVSKRAGARPNSGASKLGSAEFAWCHIYVYISVYVRIYEDHPSLELSALSWAAFEGRPRSRTKRRFPFGARDKTTSELTVKNQLLLIATLLSSVSLACLAKQANKPPQQQFFFAIDTK